MNQNNDQDSQELYEKLLRALGREIGIAELACNEESVCCVEIPGQFAIQMELVGDSFHFLAGLGVVGEERAILFPLLLEANLFFCGTLGATLAYDPEVDTIVLCRMLPIGDLTQERLLEEFTRFVEAATTWVDRLSSPEWPTEEKPPEEPYTPYEPVILA